ncbi:MAG: [FeFe] hydrogenase, group A [Clostridiales Family XIII bacterium]|jgi:NADH-quinone oxidoreductase subunit G|nr:[FeFe] hydrogenase, group A [Clostridiales Family XIII bacterium]
MVNISINNQVISVPENTTILEASKMYGINIPTLCYLKEINEIAACRICLVEIKGYERLFPACNTKVLEGMDIQTETRKVRNARRMNLQFILANHDTQCNTCVRNSNCELQNLSAQLNITTQPFKPELTKKKWDDTLPLIRDDSKCIRCMRCIGVCDYVQQMKVWDVLGSGARAKVGVCGSTPLNESDCTYCGQCITHCPVGALSARNDMDRFFDDVENPEIITVVQIAPAVRAAWQEDLHDDSLGGNIKKLASALRKLGVDYVFDTDFTADLTIMEEGSELIERLTHPDQYAWPMYTSCCPGWVRFTKSQAPDMLDNLSTAKSPQQMFGAVIKTYFANAKQIDPKKIRSISIMPCVSKKDECTLPKFGSEERGQDVDYVLTTREIDRIIKAASINLGQLEPEEFDSPMAESTGAGVIFGMQGGVMEAALRSAYYLVTKEKPPVDAFSEVRTKENAWTEAEFDIAGIKLKVAIASGLGNARRLVNAIRKKEVVYDFVEIMACPGGCVGGGGQPISGGKELADVRGKRLNALDQNAEIRFSHENPDVLKLYEDFLGAPLSHKSHELLHTNHHQ